MVKATRRAIALPSLSLTIPHGADHGRRVRSSEEELDDEEEYAEIGTPTNSEPFQKQVKFLAPEDDGDEDRMSEQSSICQSPSWEGYGLRKKEKKLEAERRKKEREQAEKQAKAAKKRGTSRLSKAPPPPPPPVPTGRDPRAVGLTTADRSMSDPLLVSQHLLPSTHPRHRPQDVGRTASADDLQQSRWHRPAVTEVLSGSSSSAGRAGGGAAEDASTAHHLLYDNTFAPRQEIRRSMSEGPAPLTQQSLTTFSSNHESRSPREVFPPSASRTPRLRHMSPSSGNRSNGMYQGAPNANYSQESLSVPVAVDGTRRKGYVGYQRAQAAERAMAGLADEQLVASAGQYYPPSRSSSGQTQHTRRPSLGQEAKSAAMKLVGMKPSSAAQDDGTNPTDYLTFKAIPYTDASAEAAPSVGSMPTSPKTLDDSFRAHGGERQPTSEVLNLLSASGLQAGAAVIERPSTSQSSVSMSTPSIAGSETGHNTRKGRSLKDAARAALNKSKGSQAPNESSKPSVSVPPFLALRSRLSSRTSVHKDNRPAHGAGDGASELASVRPLECIELFIRNAELLTRHQKLITAVSTADQGKPTELGPQSGCRASEGSSSSSAYEDGSPLPSPTTTPDTSRPQSAKDIPLTASELTKGAPGAFGIQDDEQTLRQSLDSSKSSTPRLGDPELRGSVEMGNEDRWSRTALPIDIDGDAQSFMTTVSNFDNMDEAEQVLSNSPSSPRTKKEQPEGLTLVSKNQTESGELAISVPPRSRKRDRTPIGSPTTSSPSAEQRHEDMGTAQYMIGSLEEQGEIGKSRESPKARTPRNYARPFQHGDGKERRTRESEKTAVFEGYRGEDEVLAAPNSPQREWTSGSVSSASSTVPSTGSTSPRTLVSDFQMSGNPYFGDFSEPPKQHSMPGETVPPSPMSLPSPLHQVPSKAPAQPRANSAPILSSASAGTSRASTPSARSSGMAPVSILKQPKNLTSDPSLPQTGRTSVLSALPKHMQLQAGMPVRPPTTVAEARMAPIAKMFVECCNCKFYHDMPSKLYECMAKPDAVVEDKLLGISGAITTMVKCPWCNHNMSRNCCAGYAAVVYLKEKLH